jgi:hypothetical protein
VCIDVGAVYRSARGLEGKRNVLWAELCCGGRRAGGQTDGQAPLLVLVLARGASWECCAQAVRARDSYEQLGARWNGQLQRRWEAAALRGQ